MTYEDRTPPALVRIKARKAISLTPRNGNSHITYGKGNKGKDQQPFAGKAKGKTSTTAESTSWQGDVSGVGTELGVTTEKTGISPDGMIVSLRTV